jgi:hypothetical protein
MKTFTKTTVKTYTPIWVHENFSTFNATWIKIRENMKYKGFSCFKCEKDFRDGDVISLVAFQHVGNKVLCLECAKDLK